MDAFKACNLAFKHDVQTARFLLPYIVQNAVSCGMSAALENVRAEMELVLQRGPANREGELCVQEVGGGLCSCCLHVSQASGHACPRTVWDVPRFRYCCLPVDLGYLVSGHAHFSRVKGMPGLRRRKHEVIRLVLCKQVFSLLDVLKGWVSEARTAATPSTSGG